MENTEKIMVRVRELFAASELTLDTLGLKMGYPADSARKSVWQFLNRTADPRLSMLLKFCDAIGVSLAELATEKKRAGQK